MSPRRRGGNTDQNGGAGGGAGGGADGSFDDDADDDADDEVGALDEVSQDDVELLEEGVDVDSLDEEDLVSLDDAARALLAKPRHGHGPIARLYRGEAVRLRRPAQNLVRPVVGHHRPGDRHHHSARRPEPGH